MTAETRHIPLILLAGLLCDAASWQGVADELADVAHVGIAHFPDQDSIGAMAERVLAVAPPAFALAGHSMGGRVALEVWRRAPERVLGLALLNTGVHPMGAHEPASRGRLVELADTLGMAALAAEWLPPMMSPAGLADAALMRDLTAMVGRATPQSHARQIAALLNRPDAAAVLPTITVPTLLLSGTEDRWSPVAQHAAMLSQVPHADLAVVEGAGHMAPVEKPREVAAALRGWLSRLQSPAGDGQPGKLPRYFP